ncbi:MAG: Ig-like domain-containing protein [Oscillospiraceae bacterium]|nr:Ig-like domain-containing protein [Oscillospiraceae bacterium]
MLKTRRVLVLMLVFALVFPVKAGALFTGMRYIRADSPIPAIFARKSVERTEEYREIVDTVNEYEEEDEIIDGFNERDEYDLAEDEDDIGGDTDEDKDESDGGSDEPIEVTSINLSPQILELKTNQSARLNAKCLPSNANDKSILWFSSDSAVAEVSDDGEVTALTEGTVVITAMSYESPWIYETCEITVKKDYVSSIVLGKRSVRLSVGTVMPIPVAALPDSAFDRSYTWSCDDDSVAEMTEDNVLRALSPGTAVFTVTANDYDEGSKPAESKLYVTVISAADYYCTLGKTITFTADILAQNPEDLRWKVYRLENGVSYSTNSSDVGIETRNLTCRLSGRTVGEYRVEISDPDNEWNVRTIHVSVKEPVKKVTAYLKGDEERKKIRRAELTINQNGTSPASLQIYALLEPENATYKDVYWRSSRPEVATVDEDGLVTAVSTGSAVISCISVTDGKKSNITVNVKYNSNTITLNKTEPITLRLGDSARLKATLEKSRNVSDAVLWKSSNPGAVIVKDGKITAVGTGTAVITASTAGGNRTASVTVKAVIMPKKLIAESRTIELRAGESGDIKINFEPFDVTEKTLNYDSKDERIAVVDGTGKVKAMSQGTTTVTVTAANGKKVKVNIVVR